ncbi:MAG: hypothetical protein ABIB97_02715 [Patescibacteria group bacterium]
MAKPKKQIMIVVAIVVIAGAAAGTYFGLDYLGESRLQRFEELQDEHTAKGTTVEANVNAVAVALQGLDWQTGKTESQKTITSFQEVIEIDEELAKLANQLDLAEDAAKFSKRKETEEVIIEFYQKTIECADYAIAEDQTSFATCDTEAGEIYDRFLALNEEFNTL